MNSPEDILKETVCKLQEIINPLVTRIEALEHTVNDIIIKSALDIDHEDRYNAASEKWGEQFKPFTSIMEIEKFDPYEEIISKDMDDESINTMIGSYKDKLEKIIASQHPELSDNEVKEVAPIIEEVIDKTIEDHAFEPKIEEIDESDVRSFKKGGRIK